MSITAWSVVALFVVSRSEQTSQTGSLAAIVHLRCNFPVAAQADWKGDEPTLIVKKQNFGFEISGIDAARGVAQISGELGSTGLSVSAGSGVLNFIERTPMGIFNVTSVFSSRDKVGRFKAVHSRHLSVVQPFFPRRVTVFARLATVVPDLPISKSLDDVLAFAPARD